MAISATGVCGSSLSSIKLFFNFILVIKSLGVCPVIPFSFENRLVRPQHISCANMLMSKLGLSMFFSTMAIAFSNNCWSYAVVPNI